MTIYGMNSSRSVKDIIYRIYADPRTVFRPNDVAMLLGQSDAALVNRRLNYYVKTGRLLNLRRGFYAKQGYKPEELACLLYTPSYISMEYVLQKAGVVFQYDSRITVVSYLSREVESDGNAFLYRRIKGEILVDTDGLDLQNNITIATPERAFLDVMYLNKEYYFDNLNCLDKEKIIKLLPIYRSEQLRKRVLKRLENV